MLVAAANSMPAASVLIEQPRDLERPAVRQVPKGLGQSAHELDHRFAGHGPGRVVLAWNQRATIGSLAIRGKAAK